MSLKVMIVDDSTSVRSQVRIALEPGRFEVIEADDGQTALELLRKDPTLRLIICDVNMPNIDGLELLGMLKADAQLRHIPIVMLTTEGKPELIQRAKKAGAKGWVIKPFKPLLLLAAVEKLTRQ